MARIVDTLFASILGLVLFGLILARPGFAPGQVRTAAAPQPMSTTTPPVPDATARLPGLDLSHYQGDVDWTAIAGAGVAFAFAKASDGITYTDPKWVRNPNGAASAGVPLGGYHFYQPKDDPAKQAAHFVSVLAGQPTRLPPVVDLERSPVAGQEDSYRRDVEDFLALVEQGTVCAPILYASPSFWSSDLGNEFATRPLWLAEYADTAHPPSAMEWLFWQHTQNGQVAGIGGAVDLDWFAGDAAALGDFDCKSEARDETAS